MCCWFDPAGEYSQVPIVDALSDFFLPPVGRSGNRLEKKVPTGISSMPVVPVESTVCLWVQVRGFGVVKESK